MTSSPSHSPLLRAEGVTFTYAGRETPAIQDLNLDIASAELVVVAGRTGSGKSTLLRILGGLIPRHTSGVMQGRVAVAGVDTRAARPAELAASVALVLQSPEDQLCATTVEGEVAFGLENLAVAPDEIGWRIGTALERFGLTHKRGESVQRLSGGEKQRLLLAATWALRPRVLLLDEPLAQLDPAGAAALVTELAALRDDGVAVVVAEHRLERLLDVADRAILVDSGRIAMTEPRSLPFAKMTAPQAAQRRRASAATTNRGGLIRVAGLAFRHEFARDDVWRDVSFDLCAGERVALVGANGSGKSTLLAVLAGLLAPQRGAVSLDPPLARVGAVALVPQRADDALFSKSVRAELEFGPRQQGLGATQRAARAAWAAEQFRLSELLDEPPFSLSVGQRLRVAAAAAAAMRPALLMLDEPTTGQDPEQTTALLTALDAATVEDETCLAFSTHDLALARAWADRVILLGQQRVLADGPAERILADEGLLVRAGLLASIRPGGDGPPRQESAASNAAGGSPA